MSAFIAPRLSIFSQFSSNTTFNDDPQLDIADHLDHHHHRYIHSSTPRLALPTPLDEHAHIRSTLDHDFDCRDTLSAKSRSIDLHLSIPPILHHTASSQRSQRRSLTQYHAIKETAEEQKTMTIDTIEEVAIETAPSSPPELSFSKSSKSSSSSLRSSSIDDAETDSANESPHFEELSLDEPEPQIQHVLRDSNLKPESRPTLRRPQPRSATYLTEPPFRTMMLNEHASYLTPEGHRSRKYSAPTMTPPGVLTDQSANLPVGRTMRRGFASRSTPDVLDYGRRPSRSPDKSFPASPRSSATLTPRASHEQTTPGSAPPLVKRGSRKTVAQLEAEYNDDDEDVPEEAILENVPISPLPNSSYRSLSRSPSPRAMPPLPRSPSYSNMPQPLRSPSYTNLHSANVPKNARRPSAPPMLRSPRSQGPRRPPMLQHSNTIGSYPPEPQTNRQQKSKSWDDDLNDEVRQLSMALEQYERGFAGKRNSAPSSTTTTPRRQSDAKSAKSIAELPPLQSGNIMIDPLPISKEKEAVLTRTRPSWLPPKSQKEEKRHLREWQQMMARAAKIEKERELKEQEQAEQRGDVQLSAEAIWEHEILLNWDTAKAESKKLDMRWSGIPPASRGTIWKHAVGNELELNSTSFQAALNRARRLEEKLDTLPAEELSKSKEYAWFSAIDRDVPAAFASLRRFAPGTPGNRALTDVLKAYTMYRSDLGYVYGTHLIAALLCLHMRPDDAFITLANLLNKPLPLAFLVHDQAAMQRCYAMVLHALQRQHKKLHAHLTSAALDLPIEEYLDPLFRCLFTYNFSVTQASRLWDVYILGDDQVLINATVAILGLLEPKLYGSKEEVTSLIAWKNQSNWDLGNDDLFINAVRAVKA